MVQKPDALWHPVSGKASTTEANVTTDRQLAIDNRHKKKMRKQEKEAAF